MSQKKTRILIVDDSDFIRSRLKAILESHGYEVVGEGTSGEEGFDAYKRLAPDLVLMDIVMPESDGLSGVRSIMQHDSQAKIVMVSSMATRHKVLESINAGAKNFVVKPFDDQVLLEKLSKVLES